MTMKFSIIIFTIVNWATIQTFTDIEQCGRSKSCWFIPPQCQNEPQRPCKTIISWRIDNSRLFIEFDSKIDDFSSTKFTGKYLALAFSKDDKMGDDSVLECIFKPDGTFESYISFNDDKNNHRLIEASDFLINGTIGRTENGRIFCKTERRMFENGENEIPETDRFKIFDLREKNFHLLFAKGETMPGKGYELGIHSMEDGELFPWATNEPLNLADHQIVHSMKQTDVARSLQYNLVKIHGIFMLFAWWVFGSAAILTARFMKNCFADRRLAGSPIWFQIHRAFMIFSVILQCLAFVAIFLQAGDFKMCTFVCETDYYLLKLHAILGVSCTSGAIFQPLLAFFRFPNDDARRPIFNWLHFLIGVGSWTMASVCIFLAPFLPKNGLRYHFGYTADYIMAGYICAFIFASISMEILGDFYSNSRISPMIITNKPKKSSNLDHLSNVNRYSKMQAIILIIFAIVSCSLCIALGVLIALNELI